MDFPMINEINENTNAAKKEILEAMPAAGATSAEVEAAKTAIIGAMPGGGELLVPDSYAFVYCEPESSLTTAVDVTGKGRFLGGIFSANGYRSGTTKVVVVLDGVEVLDSYLPRGVGAFVTEGGYLIDLVFTKSLKIQLQRGSASTSGSTKVYLPVLSGRIEYYE